MSLRGFTRAGHLPTLVAALLYFDVSFMTWVLLGPLAPFLREDLGLTASQQGLLTAIPLLGGSLFRPILGIVADRIGGRRTGLIGMALTLATLFVGWRFATTVYHFYALGFFLGLAGASFAVALPLASRWYPAEYQGLAMGIAGAGNSGTLMATLFAPRLAERLGWAPTFGIAMLPVATVFVLFAWLARDSPKRVAATSLRSYGAVLREHDTLWLSFLYSLTFGGFVGFASFLTTFFHEQYQLTRVTAGDFTTLVVVSGSLLRPVGGWLADRVGGYRLLVMLLAGAAVCVGAVASLPPVYVTVVLLFIGMGMLGMGNGAVFQLVPQRFPDRMGIVTGVVGAAGGLGGFFLPSILGAVRDATGSYASGLFGCAAVFLVGTVVLLELGARWSLQWDTRAIKQAGVYSYRQALFGIDTERAA
ncbi:MAG TPA: MFS transporter [Vicinamibacterales bacterium]|jgi:NNP family nitrate/nitrite transporter-like MFS transporter|nr:MFS transporter [Vicinamibacterales bacterium]